MGFRKQRKGILRSLGNRAVHTYEDRNGVKTCTGSHHTVSLTIEVTDGPDKGRWITVDLTPEEARRRAQSLLDAADRVEALKD